MSRPQGLKVVVGGPCRTGKTVISNFLSDTAGHMNFQDRYEKTAGVRVLEFERSVGGGYGSQISVELWDCSGDEKYESCYPAMTQDASAAILARPVQRPLLMLVIWAAHSMLHCAVM